MDGEWGVKKHKRFFGGVFFICNDHMGKQEVNERDECILFSRQAK
jgi:hypothetical protein